MAIIKELNSSFGVGASYHKIASISIDYTNKKVIVCICTYVSKEKRIQNYDPIDSIDIEIPQEDFETFLNGNILVTAYRWLKNNVVGFEDAVDDMDVCSKLAIVDDEKCEY